jgi:hypothetical protein
MSSASRAVRSINATVPEKPMTLTDDNMTDCGEIIDTEPDATSGGVVPDALIDAVMASVDAGEIELLGENGAIAELTKRILEGTVALFDRGARFIAIGRRRSLRSLR